MERTRDGMHEIEETDWRKKEEGRRRRMENVNFLTCFAKKMFIAPFADFEDRTEWLLRFTESPSSFWLVISDWNRGVGIGNNHKSRRRRNCCSNKVDKLVAFRFVTSWELCQSFSPLFHSNRATFACVLRFSLTYTRFWTKNCFVFRYVIRETANSIGWKGACLLPNKTGFIVMPRLFPLTPFTVLLLDSQRPWITDSQVGSRTVKEINSSHLLHKITILNFE